jgi:protein-disulfide isomerase
MEIFQTTWKWGLLVLSILAQPGIAAESGKGAERAVVVIDGVRITAAEVERNQPGQIFQARNGLFKAEKEAAAQYIDHYLLEREAKKAKLTVAELLEQKTSAAAGSAPSQEALRFYYDGLDAKEPLEAIQDKIIDLVRQRRIEKAKAKYMESLRAQAKIEYVLAAPRIAMTVAGAPVRGSADAPVRIVEFADYQCPYCKQAKPFLEKLLQEFPGKVALEYKDLPLPNHPQAQKAAEAAHCAGAEGKYWEYHDALYTRDRLDLPALKEYARELKLDLKAFDACLETGAKAQFVKDQFEEAKQLALPGTPAFFVNGRFIEGASYEALRQAVEEELAARN